MSTVAPGHAALLDILEREGSLTPTAVLDEARPEESPLHRYFTWEDGEAAERYRLLEASHLIRRYKFTVTVEPERTIRVRNFVSVPSPEGGSSYADIRSAMKSSEGRDVVMQQALREVAALRAKYQALVDFDEVLQRSLKQRRKKTA